MYPEDQCTRSEDAIGNSCPCLPVVCSTLFWDFFQALSVTCFFLRDSEFACSSNFSEVSRGIGSRVVRRQQPPAQVSTSSEINHAAA